MAKIEQSLLSKQIAANTKATEESTENLVNLEEKLLSLYDEKGKRLHGNRKIGEETVAKIRRDTAATIQDDKKVIELKEKENKILKDNTL